MREVRQWEEEGEQAHADFNPSRLQCNVALAGHSASQHPLTSFSCFWTTRSAPESQKNKDFAKSIESAAFGAQGRMFVAVI